MSSTTQLEAWLNGTPTGGPNSDGRYPLVYADGQTYLVYCPAAQALNPALNEQPIEVFANTANAAANTATTQASTATTASLAAQTSAANALVSQNAAAASATTASNQATAAGTSATNASNSATAASGSAGAAADSATTANTANTNAGLARDKAQKWADEVVDVTVEPSKYSARHWAQKAADSVAGGHVHTIANVTGLQTALDGKQAALGYSPVNKAGDTMTGSLNIATSGIEAQLNLTPFGGGRTLRVLSNTTPNGGIYDVTNSAWLIRIDANNDTHFAASINANDSGNPALASAAFTAFGAYGGGFRMIDSGIHTGMWTQNDSTMRFGIGTDAGLTQRFQLTTVGADLVGTMRAGNYVAELGSPGTQQILGTWKYATGPDRMYYAIEASGAYSLYMKNASGVAVGDYQKFEITLDAKRVYFDSSGIGTLGSIYGRDITASRGDGTGVIFLNGAGSRYVFFDGAKYVMPGARLHVDGVEVWSPNNLNPANAGNLTTGTVGDAVMPSGMKAGGTSHTDWNNANANGIWMAAGAANSPGGGGWYIGRVTVHNSDWITQEVYDFTNNAGTNVYRRAKMSGTWGAWTQEQYIGGHRLRNDSGFLLSDSAMRRVGSNQRLSADAASWVNEPRVFVQSTDPGAAAADGDLWVW